jgi:hypothetical protein
MFFVIRDVEVLAGSLIGGLIERIVRFVTHLDPSWRASLFPFPPTRVSAHTMRS